MHPYLGLGVTVVLLMLMYVVLRLGGNPMNNKVYSPRKQSFLDKLEGIDVPTLPPLTYKEDKPMAIGTEAMKQLKTLAKNDALSIDLDATLAVFNSTYQGNGSVDVDQMIAETEPMPPVLEDQVNAPSHYMLWPDTEVIDILRKVLSEDELRGWMKGNSLKYRLRLGAKDNTEQDLAKAEKFEQWLGDLH